MKTNAWVAIVLVVLMGGFALGVVVRHLEGVMTCAQAEYQGQAVQFCGQRLTVELVAPAPTPNLPEIKGRP